MNSSREMAPDRTKVPAPMVALTSMLGSAASNTIARASFNRSISLRNPTRMRREAARRGASVFPAAVAAAATREVLIGAFTRSAAIPTPGHSRRPNTRNATRAIPVGGHRGVTFSSTSAMRRLRRPTM